MSISLDVEVLDQLNQQEAKDLHETSNKLSACGIGKIVDLPQLVVVGEQSAGKSSVLEAISHVSFPVEEGVCTRFATELIFRHAARPKLQASVKFANNARQPHVMGRKEFDKDAIRDIIREAREHMNLSPSGNGFSEDALRLEIEGPSMYPLSIVDLPGIFQNKVDDQTDEDKVLVDKLVNSYMRQPNSIILVVVSADRNLAAQPALSRVDEIDPTRQRTIGIITKPDLPVPGYENESRYVRLAKNLEKANELKLGWHVLRNKAENEKSSDRDAVEEQFFDAGAWASIPKPDVGVASLRKKLSKVLYEHLRSCLPRVMQDIETQIELRQDELDRLGDERSTAAAMRTFLLKVASQFQLLAKDGVEGRYNQPFFGDLDAEDRKLRAQLRNFSRAFDHVLRTKGSKKILLSDGDDEEEDSLIDDDVLPEYMINFLKRYPYNFEEPEVLSSAALRDQLKRQASINQGQEFPGLPKHDLVIQLFKDQSSPWKEISEFHVNYVTLVSKGFVEELFEHIIGSLATNKTTQAVLVNCVDKFFLEKEEILKNKLEELFYPYSEGVALPLDAPLRRVLSDRSRSRLASRLSSALEDTGSGKRDTPINKQAILDAIDEAETIDDDEFGTGKIVDMTKAYYETCRRTFTDNVINLAIESCLIRDIPEILTPTKVGGMTDEELAKLAAESDESKKRRAQLLDELKRLREGMKQCRPQRIRTTTVLPGRERPRAMKESPSTPATRSTLSSQMTPKSNQMTPKSKKGDPFPRNPAKNVEQPASVWSWGTPAPPSAWGAGSAQNGATTQRTGGKQSIFGSLPEGSSSSSISKSLNQSGNVGSGPLFGSSSIFGTAAQGKGKQAINGNLFAPASQGMNDASAFTKADGKQ